MMNKYIATALIAPMALVSYLPAFGQDAITHSQTVLANGLRVHFLDIPSDKNRLDVRLQVGVGASDEIDTEIGAAHMVEHMVFRRADEYPDGVGEFLMNHGFRRGANFNAMTNYERTLYMFSPNKGINELDTTLKALSAMMSPHAFSDEDWQKEKSVIMHEWRNGQGVNERMNRKRTDAIRSDSRQARWAIIGTTDSIQNTPVETLQAFFERWYVPSNMTLLISGDLSGFKEQSQPSAPLLDSTDLISQNAQSDIRPYQSLLAKVTDYFGAMPNGNLPMRDKDYYEPILKNDWHALQLQDKDSGVSQAALIFRFDDTPSRDYQTINGSKQRLIDRFANHILGERLRQAQFSGALSNVALRKSDIGRHTVAVGLFASVAPDEHDQALKELITVRAKLLQTPVSEAEFDSYKNSLQNSIASANKKTTLQGEFGEVIMTVSDGIFNDKPVRVPAQNAAITAQILPSISRHEVDLRIHQWLTASDVLIQVQAPALTEVVLPNAKALKALATKELSVMQPALNKKPASEPEDFDITPVLGIISSEEADAHTNTVRYTLSNGDTVVILTNPVAKGKLYLSAVSEMGFMSDKVGAWQSQLASQIVWQSGTAGVSAQSVDNYKKTHKISLSHSLQANEQKVEGSADNNNAQALFKLYHSYYISPSIGDGWTSATRELMRSSAMSQSTSRQKQSAIAKLRFGETSTYATPTQEALKAIDEKALLDQWQTLSGAKTNYFILTDQPAESLKPLLTTYLAGINKQPTQANSMQQLTLKGQETAQLSIGSEEKADITMWSFYERAWTPERALQVALLQDIASDKLKAKLRDEHLGVYSARFSSQFNQQSGRVESNLSFVTDPKRSDEMMALAVETLTTLPQQLSETDVQKMRAKFLRDEPNRLKDPAVWLSRLVLSHKAYGDARYIENMDKLADSLTLDNFKQSAHLLWSEQNTRTLAVMPK